jgi:hypothetical protein
VLELDGLDKTLNSNFVLFSSNMEVVSVEKCPGLSFLELK